MNSVWRRIFVTSGIAGLVMLALGTLLTFALIGERISDVAGARTGEIAEQAALALHAGGETGLAQWLRAQDEDPVRDRVLVVGADGKDLLGREVPRAMAARTRSYLGRIGADDTIPGFRPSRWVPQLVMPDGTLHAVYVEHKSPGLLERIDIPGLPFVLALLAVLASGAVAGVLARNLSRPIRDLTAVTREIAGGRVDARVGADVTARRDELGALGRDFNAMADRLDALVQARERLIRDMSHELRTPLARLNVALELLRRKDPAGQLETDLARIEQQVDRLDAMIESILGFARLDAIARAPEFRVLPLAPLAAEVVEEARLEAAERDCVVELSEAPAEPVLVHAHAAMLRSALQNVLRNAIRHTQEGSRVTVRIARRDGEVDVGVRDHGPGVPEEHLGRIFEPFYRVDDSRGRDPHGTGLGLAIVARILRMHRGSVQARNVPAGGFEVTLSLPVAGPGDMAAGPDLSATVDPPERDALTQPVA
jgi:two-component system sensor histidine kinase CpxA